MLTPRSNSWLIPGRLSTAVIAVGTLPIPAGGTSTVLEYTVPQGLRFTLRGVVVSVVDPSNTWVQGSGSLLFQLLCVGTGGTRVVENFEAVITPRGSSVVPYPVLGRCEFIETDLLRWTVTASGVVTPGLPQLAICHLLGWTYPISDCE